MNHDLIGAAIIAVGLIGVYIYALRCDERARNDALLLAFLDEDTEEINLDAINEGRRSLLLMPVRDAAELAALTTTADLPEEFRC